MFVVTGQSCSRESSKGAHCWHRQAHLARAGAYEEIVEQCCWCGTTVHYRGPGLDPQGHGPYFAAFIPVPLDEEEDDENPRR